MNIIKSVNDNEMIIKLEGRLDANTAGELERELINLDGIEKLVFDFIKLDYISSTGLRILLQCQKRMAKYGGITVRNINVEIRDIFDITGFDGIITVE